MVKEIQIPKTMKAAVKTKAGDFEIKTIPVPKITQPDYALVRVRGAGICGSDLHNWKVPAPKENLWAGEGAIAGHENAGGRPAHRGGAGEATQRSDAGPDGLPGGFARRKPRYLVPRRG